VPATFPENWRETMADGDATYLETLKRFASPAAVSHGYRPAVAVSAAFSVVAALAALGIRRRTAVTTLGR